MKRKLKILIVEDEEAIRNGLIDVLLYHGFETDTAVEGHSGLDKALSGKYDLILLDVMLPGIDGFEICNQIRKKDREQAIIMLTAKSEDDDIIQGLQLGADDYISKPFSVAQLVLRIQAVLRRAHSVIDTENILQLDHQLQIDCKNMTANKNNTSIKFTRREMDILQYLFAHSDRPVARDELLNKIWGYAKNLEMETRTVDIHIAKLRRKLEDNPAKPLYIVTIRGAGYKLMLQHNA